MAFNDYMLDVAYIQQRTGRTAMGGASYSFDAPGTLLECRAMQMSRNQSMEYDATGQTRMWKLITSSDPKWKNGDRVHVTKQGGAEVSFYLEVHWTGVQTRNGVVNHYSCSCKEVTSRRDY